MDNTPPVLSPSDPIGGTSSLYDQILIDFLSRAEADGQIPPQVVKNLKKAFAEGPPKSADLVIAFSVDDDVE